MGTNNPDQPRACPSQLTRLLETADGPEHERAWAEFLESYSRLILHVARRLPRDHDRVMDRYAFVLERLREQHYRRLRSFTADGRGKFTTWLTVVVRRLCLDHDRHRYGRAPVAGAAKPAMPHRLVELVLDPEALDRLPDGRPSVEEVFDLEQALKRLAAAVTGLSPRDQLLLALRYQDDRSAREIASLMSLPTAFHVYRRLDRIHRSLRQALSAPSAQGGRSAGGTSDPTAVQYQWRPDKPLKPTP